MKDEVVDHVLGHNHLLMHGDLGHYVRSERNMSKEKAMAIKDVHTSRISVVDS